MPEYYATKEDHLATLNGALQDLLRGAECIQLGDGPWSENERAALLADLEQQAAAKREEIEAFLVAARDVLPTEWLLLQATSDFLEDR